MEDQTEIIRYRYQIDIDGTTSAWSSLFLKLLNGSPEIPKAMKTLGRLIVLNARGILPPGGRSSRLAKICTAGEMQS